MSDLVSSAEALTNALDNLDGSEHPWSKTIRRFLKKTNGDVHEITRKFRDFISHDDGLLDSIDNDLIQLCYASSNKEDEYARVQMCIELITSKTAFMKNMLIAEQG